MTEQYSTAINFWEYRQGQQWKPLDVSPLPGLYDFDQQPTWDGNIFDHFMSNAGYQLSEALVGYSISGPIKLYETERRQTYRFMIDMNSPCGQDDLLFFPALPDLFSFMQMLVSVQGASQDVRDERESKKEKARRGYE